MKTLEFLPFPLCLFFVKFLMGDVFLSDLLLGGGACLSSNSLFEVESLEDDLDEETLDVVAVEEVVRGCISSRSLFCLLVCIEEELATDCFDDEVERWDCGCADDTAKDATGIGFFCRLVWIVEEL